MMTTRLHAHARPLQGLAYLAVLALLVAASVAAYTKSLPWQRSVAVILPAPSAGLEMEPLADVKLQGGITVGEVREITSDGTGATLHLALNPSMVHLIPANVDARIVPKTLFGAKYVDLVLPRRPATERISGGDVIRQSVNSVEIGQLYAKLVPILQALDPQQLSVTLDAMAQALQGRGAELGQTIELLHRYLGGLNPYLPAIVDDVHQLAATADLYAANAPDLLRVLDNSRAISAQLLVPQEKSFAGFLAQTITTADQANSVFSRNAHELITLSGAAKPVEQVLAEYSSEFPCLITSLNLMNAAIDHVSGQEPYARITIDLYTQRPAYRYPSDAPNNPRSDANNDMLPQGVPSWAPHCAVIPPQLQGLQDIPPFAESLEGPVAPANGAASPQDPAGASQALATAIAGQSMGMPASRVPGVAGLLLAPMMAGGQVTAP